MNTKTTNVKEDKKLKIKMTSEEINKMFKEAALNGELTTVKEIIEQYCNNLEPLDNCTKRFIAFRGNVKLLKFIDSAIAIDK